MNISLTAGQNKPLVSFLENDKDLIKWLRQAEEQLRIWWHHNSKKYQPDFIAEMRDCIYMIETKAANEIDDTDVQEKTTAAIKYCNYATVYTAEHGGKPWKYVLIPHDKVAKNSGFKGIVAEYIL